MDKTELAIIGRGPAGLSAAIYTGRAGIKTLVLGKQPKIASGDYEIDNYFSFPDGTTGKDLIDLGVRHAERFGAKFLDEMVLAVHMNQDMTYTIKTKKGEVKTCAIILATGVSRVKPGIKNLDEYDGKGVSYCVSCDGFFYKNKPVMVLGEGDYAANQAVELLNYTPEVKVCTQGKKPTMDQNSLDMLSQHDIPVIKKKIETLAGENGLSSVAFDDGEQMEVHGLFIAMGEASSTDFAKSLGILTEGVYITADDNQATNLPGVFAAGDCTGGFLQISVAVGEGATAARSAIGHVKKNCRKKEAE